jgi:hypothetical protein
MGAGDMCAGGVDDAVHQEFLGGAAVQGAAVGNARMKEVRKVFFSEEKKQKTFIFWCSRHVPQRGTKVFWFFFSKKNILTFS